MKIKLFVAREIQYFELRIFSYNSYVCYLTRGFIASTRAVNLVTRAFSLVTRAFSLLTRGFELVTREFELVTHGFELLTRVLLLHLLTGVVFILLTHNYFIIPMDKCSYSFTHYLIVYVISFFRLNYCFNAFLNL